MTRQLQRAQYRQLASSALKGIVKLPRDVRRVGARAYATACWRALKELPAPRPRHRYVNFVINQSVRDWVIRHGTAA